MKYDPILGDDWIPRVLTSIYSCIIIGLSKNRGSTPNSILTVKIFIQWMKWGALIFRLKFIRTGCMGIPRATVEYYGMEDAINGAIFIPNHI